MDSAIEPIEDDELLYRRIPVSMGWYAVDRLSPQAFGPRKDETTGISVFRAKYRSIREAAAGKSKKGYYVAVLRVGDLRQRGIEVVPRPELPDGQYELAHAELPDLNSATRTADATLERQRILAEELCLRVEGPFETQENAST